MRFFQHTFVVFLLGNSAGVIARHLMIKSIGNDLLDSTPVQSLVSRLETRASEIVNDINLFTPSGGAADHSIFLPEISESDDLCPMQTSLLDDEGGTFESSDSEGLWTRGLENEDLGPLAESNDRQCHQGMTNPKKPNKEVVPQVPSLWPLVYPEVPEGRCPDLIRPIATCCAARDGTKPLDCWPFGVSLGWCLVGYQYCCKEINQAQEGIDCSPVNWGQPSKEQSLEDMFVLPWDIRLLRRPGT